MLSKDQKQDVGTGATAIQAGGNVTYGVTAAEARAIALDVSKVMFYELSGEAKDIASARVEVITDRVIERLKEEYPEGLNKAKDPDFQYALCTVQKEFARSGDEDLGDLLVDLLVDRSKQDQRNLRQIVLNESLATAPKLTDEQLACLAVIFLFRYTQRGVGNHEALGQYFDLNVLPFVGKLSKSHTCYQHLEFTGCGTVQMGEISLEQVIGEVYPGLFMTGFDPAEIEARGITIGLDSGVFVPCLNASEKYQINACNKKVLEQALSTHGVSVEDSGRIRALFDSGKMTTNQIKDACIKIRPYMADVFDVWSNSPMKSFTLTSVGIAIGHANVKRLNGVFGDLSIWIN